LTLKGCKCAIRDPEAFNRPSEARVSSSVLAAAAVMTESHRERTPAPVNIFASNAQQGEDEIPEVGVYWLVPQPEGRVRHAAQCHETR